MSSKAVVANKLQYLSASGIETFLLCPKKWVAIYVYGHREPEVEGSSTALGTWGHSRLEDGILKGIEPGYDENGQRLPPFTDSRKNTLVQSLSLALNYLTAELDFVPGQPPEGLEIEMAVEKKSTLTIAGTRIHGRLDLADFRDPKHPLIWDLKTCNGFGNALSAKPTAPAHKYLKNKIQVQIYVAYAFNRCPEAEEVKIGYLYANAAPDGTPNIRPVQVTFTREESDASVEKLVPIVDAIQKAARTTDLQDAPAVGRDKPLRDACKAFNKECHVQAMGLCKPALFGTSSTTTQEPADMTSFLEKLAARKAQQNGTAAPAQVAAAEGPSLSGTGSPPSFSGTQAAANDAVEARATEILRDLVSALDRARALVGSGD